VNLFIHLVRPVIWIGRFEGGTGFSTSTREYFQYLQTRISRIYAASLDILLPDDPLYSAQMDTGFIELLEERGDRPLKVVNHLPITDPEAEVYFSVIEFAEIPPRWIEPLQQARLIITQSQFCKDVFSKYVSDPSIIKIIPYIIPQEFQPTGPIDRRVPLDVCAFGSVFEWIPRKVPERMLTAFMEEFALNEPVRFLIRATHPTIKDLEKYVKKQFPDPRICVIKEKIPDLAAFYRGLDGYCSPTAGEGWGQTLTEAMVCGIPTIGSRHSGNLDFMNDENSYLVDVGEWQPVPEEPTSSYRLPDIDSIKSCLREIYQIWKSKEPNPKIARALQLRQILSRERIGPKLYEVLLPLLEN
jgi:glycosyltransferase involved in cell wall biosynthesis